MRSSDCDIVMVPGLGGSGPDHWQRRWAGRLSTARFVEPADLDRPDPGSWTESLQAAVAAAARPVVVVGHSLGVVAVVRTAPELTGVVGALLVAPPDLDRAELPPGIDPAFLPVTSDPLPFPSLLVASRTDPWCSFEAAEDLAYAWGSALVDAGAAGHITAESGFGPWPEGLMRFAGFLKQL